MASVQFLNGEDHLKYSPLEYQQGAHLYLLGEDHDTGIEVVLNVRKRGGGGAPTFLCKPVA